MQFRQKTLASQCGRISRASSSSIAATTGEASLATGKECSLVSKHHNELLLQVQRSKRVKELRAETRTGETHERLHSASPAGSYHPLVLLLQSDRIGLDSFLFFLQGRQGTIFVDCIKYESAGGARKRKTGSVTSTQEEVERDGRARRDNEVDCLYTGGRLLLLLLWIYLG